MPQKAKKEQNDVLDRLDKDVNPEMEMSAAPAKAEEQNAEASAPASRKKERAKANEARVSREQRLADEQAELTAESSIRSAIKAGTVFSGVASAVEVIKGKGEEEEVALIVLLNRTVKVVIPFADLFTYNPIEMKTVDLSSPEGRREYIKRKRAFAEKMIGASISFTISNVFPDGIVMTTLGSRADAMKRMSKRIFSGQNPRCKVGDIGDAVITAVSRHAIAVEFNGVDVVIPQYKLTLRWMLYVQEYYSIGDKIRVKVRQIDLAENGDVKAVVLDPIACELADSKERYALLKDGSRVRGIVTNVYRPVGTRNIFIYAWLPQWEIPAKILRINANDFGREIKAGTQLRLEVAGHDENGYVTCIALSEHGNGGMFNRSRPVNNH